MIIYVTSNYSEQIGDKPIITLGNYVKIDVADPTKYDQWLLSNQILIEGLLEQETRIVLQQVNTHVYRYYTLMQQQRDLSILNWYGIQLRSVNLEIKAYKIAMESLDGSTPTSEFTVDELLLIPASVDMVLLCKLFKRIAWVNRNYAESINCISEERKLVLEPFEGYL